MVEVQNNISENDKSNQHNKFIQSSLNIKTNNINIKKSIKRKADNIDNVIAKDDKLYNISENENIEDKGEENKNFFYK